MAGRILIIRGGAIGDFILTLPAIGLIRENLPSARIEVLGYPGICQIALHPLYADAIHSIEYAPLAGFFSRRPTLDPELGTFFASFQQIISYLYDPDGIFEQNLRQVGVKNLLVGPGKLSDEAHATQQLARPLEQLAFFLDDPVSRILPSPADLLAAGEALAKITAPFVVLHPGSGGKQKNWLAERWLEIVRRCQRQGFSVLLVGGEADQPELELLKTAAQLPVAESLPLRVLAAVITQSALFLGHDSGISHLAAATGTRCLVLFGPTDPEVWAPLNPAVEVLVSPDGTMAALTLEKVSARVEALLNEISQS